MVKSILNSDRDENHLSRLFDDVTSPFVSCLSGQQKAYLKRNCKLRSYTSGSIIVQRDEATTSVYIVLLGCVHVLNYSISGRAITYTSLGPDDIFGEMAAIDSGPRSACVLALADCQVVQIPGSVFMELAEKNHKFALSLLEKLVKNVRMSNERMTDIFSLDAEKRACIELIRMATQDPSKPHRYFIEEMPTQSNFATLIGASRETVSRIMSRLKNDAIIKMSKRDLQILDKKKLEKKAFY